tara:strand:+ start:825 stop:1034 length:210 start_codon:yes stop_codon:yes gene_type:complete
MRDVIEIKCVKGFFITDSVGVMQGEVWEFIGQRDGSDLVFECKKGINRGMSLPLDTETLVNNFEFIAES